MTDEHGIRHHDGITYATTPGYRPRLLDVRVPAGEGPSPWSSGSTAADGWTATGATRRRPFRPRCCTVRSWGPDWPSSPSTTGTASKPFPAQLHDVKAAIRYVRAYAGVLGLAADRIAVWGESAGGHLAALAGLVGPDSADGAALEGAHGVGAGDTGVRAVVDWYGVSDLISLSEHPMPAMPPGVEFPDPYEALLGAGVAARPELAKAASPVTHAAVASNPPPFLLVHGRLDGLVPYSQSELLAAALESAGGEVVLRPVEGADHIFLGSPDVPRIVAESVAFLSHHLRPEA